MKQNWKDVVGYEGIYIVSDKGDVKRVNHNSKGVNTKYRKDNYCLKPLDNGKGYFRVKLTVKNKSKRVLLHRIIAEAFILNPENKKTVNHLDGNKKNNSIDNLEWCSQSENILHAYKTGLKTVTQKQRDTSRELMRKIHLSRKDKRLN